MIPDSRNFVTDEKQAGTDPQRKQPLSRADAISWAMEVLTPGLSARPTAARVAALT